MSGGFFIFLFMVNVRGIIFTCSAGKASVASVNGDGGALNPSAEVLGSSAPYGNF